MATSQSELRIIANRYAEAAFSHALNAQKEDAMLADLQGLATALAESAELEKLISNPSVSAQDKTSAIEAIAVAGKADVTTITVISFIAKEGRLEILPLLADIFEERLIAERGEVKANVTSAKPLKKPQLAQIEKALAAATGKKVIVETREDASLIGGLRIAIGSRMLDHSIKGKLQYLRSHLREVPLG